MRSACSPTGGGDAIPYPRSGDQASAELAAVNTIPDLVFVVAEQNRGWILDAICHEIAERVDASTAFHYGGGPLPPARAYFFSHFLLFVEHRHDPSLRDAPSIVYFTHPRPWGWRERRRLIGMLREATVVVSMSSMHAALLRDAGLPDEKVAVVVGAADPDHFRPHARGDGAVGFCSAHQARKAPHLVAGLVRALPHREFRLLGRDWPSAPEFADLSSRSNFTYLELDYEHYPSFYDGLDVFVSPSELEGGPIPLLEAMMANVVPVSTRTGFAPDVIEHGVNGFLCDVGSTVEELAGLVEAAFTLENDIRPTVEHLTWERVADAVLALAGSRRTGSGSR
jgi:glycosyltransferase involved in cell wall biosynthesis